MIFVRGMRLFARSGIQLGESFVALGRPGSAWCGEPSFPIIAPITFFDHPEGAS